MRYSAENSRRTAIFLTENSRERLRHTWNPHNSAERSGKTESNFDFPRFHFFVWDLTCSLVTAGWTVHKDLIRKFSEEIYGRGAVPYIMSSTTFLFRGRERSEWMNDINWWATRDVNSSGRFYSRGKAFGFYWSIWEHKQGIKKNDV